MPRGRGKGGNKRKKGKAMQTKEKRELQFKEEGQEYGQVDRLLGNGRVDCRCMDGKKRMCTIRGSMRNRVWINAGDIVLIGLREFGDDAKADIIAKYFDEEAHELQELGELPANIQIAVGGGMGLSSGEDGDYGGESGSDDEDQKEEAKVEEKVNIDDI